MNEKIISLSQKGDTIVMKLTNGDNKVVYMKYTDYSLEKLQLLFIDTDTFKKYWARNTYDEYSRYTTASENELRQDYKFEYAEKGFSHGEKDPVPLAIISLLDITTPPCIDITDGYTRTVWLMANNYKIIPFDFANVTSDFLNEKGVYTLNNIREWIYGY